VLILAPEEALYGARKSPPHYFHFPIEFTPVPTVAIRITNWRAVGWASAGSTFTFHPQAAADADANAADAADADADAEQQQQQQQQVQALQTALLTAPACTQLLTQHQAALYKAPKSTKKHHKQHSYLPPT
jgi:hypothetical protein